MCGGPEKDHVDRERWRQREEREAALSFSSSYEVQLYFPYFISTRAPISFSQEVIWMDTQSLNQNIPTYINLFNLFLTLRFSFFPNFCFQWFKIYACFKIFDTYIFSSVITLIAFKLKYSFPNQIR